MAGVFRLVDGIALDTVASRLPPDRAGSFDPPFGEGSPRPLLACQLTQPKPQPRNEPFERPAGVVLSSHVFKQQFFPNRSLYEAHLTRSQSAQDPRSRANHGRTVHKTRMSLEINIDSLEVRWQNLARMCASSLVQRSLTSKNCEKKSHGGFATSLGPTSWSWKASAAMQQ